MKKNQVMVAQLAIAAEILYEIITNPERNGLNVEYIQNMIKSKTNTKCECMNIDYLDTSVAVDWKKIACMAMKKCTKVYPINTVIDLKRFCNQNPEITTWLDEVCEETEVNDSEYGYFRLQLMLAINNQLVLSEIGPQLTKKETIQSLIGRTNKFFEGSSVSPIQSIDDDVLSYIAATTVMNIKTTSPDILKKYNKQSSDWRTSINNYLTKYSVHYINTWPINNGEHIDSYSVKEETTA